MEKWVGVNVCGANIITPQGQDGSDTNVDVLTEL